MKFFILNEEHANVNYIKRDLVKPYKSIKPYNMTNFKISSEKDLVRFVSDFRDTRYETFRIIYLKNDRIVGSDSITSRIPDRVHLNIDFKNTKFYKNKDRHLYYYKHKKERLDADSYYILHNHPINNTTFSENDQLISTLFKLAIPGFLGHVVIGQDHCRILEPDLKHYKVIKYPSYRYDKGKVTKIQTAADAFSYGKKYVDVGVNSILLYCSGSHSLTDVQKIKDTEFNNREIIRYLSNEKLKHGSFFIYIITTNENIYNNFGPEIEKKVITDIILFNKNDYRSYVKEFNIKQDDTYNVLGKTKRTHYRY